MISELNRSLAEIIGIQSFIRNLPLIDLALGQESRGDYQVAMQSIFPEKVYPSAQKLIDAMAKDSLFQGVNSDLEINSSQVNVKILRDKAASLGITAADIENAFMFSYSYNYVTRIETAVDQYNVILELFDKYQMDTDISILSGCARLFRMNWCPWVLSLNGSWGWGPLVSIISTSSPSVTIDFNLAKGVTLEQAMNRLQELQKELVDPVVLVQPIGAIQSYQDSIKNAGFLLFIAIFAIYIILGMLYESFVHPITVLTTLPPATLGGLLTLGIYGLPLSMYSYLGIILLIGIVKKNGIMMVDFALTIFAREGWIRGKRSTMLR